MTDQESSAAQAVANNTFWLQMLILLIITSAAEPGIKPALIDRFLLTLNIVV